MELLDKLRQLAIEYDACCEQEKRLKASVQETKEYNQLKDTNQKTKLEISLGWGIFCLVEVLFMVLINKGASYVLTLIANQGMTREEFVSAGGFGYRIVQVIPVVGVVLALPIAFFSLFLVKGILKYRDRKTNQENLRQNAKTQTENMAIQAQNQAIIEQNHQIAEQLEVIKNKKQEIKGRLQQEDASFPVGYLSVPVINFVEQELISGQAQNINQALVHYEATNDN